MARPAQPVRPLRRERAAGMVAVSIDRAGVITMPTALPPGVTTFKITTTRRQAGLQLVALAPGYTVEQATLDVENGLDKNRIKALKRFEANTTLLGGVERLEGQGRQARGRPRARHLLRRRLQQDRLAVAAAVRGRCRHRCQHEGGRDADGGRQHEVVQASCRHPAQRLAEVQEPGRPEPLRRHGEAVARQDAGRLRRLPGEGVRAAAGGLPDRHRLGACSARATTWR